VAGVTRLYFAVVGLVGLVTGAVLLLAPATTGEYFSWPIQPPQTAVFMGAGYLGTGVTMGIGLFLARSWAEARLIIPPIMVFAASMVAATLIHADRFLWDRFITWLWLGLYCLIVLGAIGIQLLERRRGGVSGGPPLSRMERAALFAVGAVTMAWALPLFVAPAFGSALWPWMLSPLTARVIAGWVGVAATLALVAGAVGDTPSVRLPLLGWTITVMLFLIASALNLGAFSQGDLRTPVYFAALIASVVGAAWLLARVQARLRSGPALA
jgi:hypothetical protein